jgi:hypothetical protein
MQYPQVFVCFALVPLATSAVAECLKSNVEGQSAQGKASLQSVVRAMLLDGRRLRTFFDSPQMPVSMPTTATKLSGERARFTFSPPTKSCGRRSGA